MTFYWVFILRYYEMKGCKTEMCISNWFHTCFIQGLPEPIDMHVRLSAQPFRLCLDDIQNLFSKRKLVLLLVMFGFFILKETKCMYYLPRKRSFEWDFKWFFSQIQHGLSRNSFVSEMKGKWFENSWKKTSIMTIFHGHHALK